MARRYSSARALPRGMWRGFTADEDHDFDPHYDASGTPRAGEREDKPDDDGDEGDMGDGWGERW